VTVNLLQFERLSAALVDSVSKAHVIRSFTVTYIYLHTETYYNIVIPVAVTVRRPSNVHLITQLHH